MLAQPFRLCGDSMLHVQHTRFALQMVAAAAAAWIAVAVASWSCQLSSAWDFAICRKQQQQQHCHDICLLPLATWESAASLREIEKGGSGGSCLYRVFGFPCHTTRRQWLRQRQLYLSNSISLAPLRVPYLSLPPTSLAKWCAIQRGICVCAPRKRQVKLICVGPETETKLRRQSQLLNCVKCRSIKFRLHNDKSSYGRSTVPS